MIASKRLSAPSVAKQLDMQAMAVAPVAFKTLPDNPRRLLARRALGALWHEHDLGRNPAGEAIEQELDLRKIRRRRDHELNLPVWIGIDETLKHR